MSNYRQKIIPETTTEGLKGNNRETLRKVTQDYYDSQFRYSKNEITNEDLGIKITFTKIGRNKTARGAAMYLNKAAAVRILDKLLRYAKYSNWGNRKEKDKPYVIGYLNFKVKFKVDGELMHYVLNVQLCVDGKFHYSLDQCRLNKKANHFK